MQKIFTVVLLSLLFVSGSLAQTAKYVVLITIDGFRPDFYLDPSWNTPNLQRLKNDGVYAEGVRGVFPSVTYPSHTTIITGVFPAKHGIYYNAPFEPYGASGKWNWESSKINCPTIWKVLHDAHLKTAALFWPVTLGADIDHNLPEVWSVGKTPDRVAPMREFANPKGFFEEAEQHSTGTLSADDLDGDHLSMDENIARMAAYTIKTYKPNFIAVHFPGVDEAEHSKGRDGLRVRAAVASVDRCIGVLLDAIADAHMSDSTALLITGDHGFADIHTTIFPNVWLASHGLIKRVDSIIEWDAKFHSAGGSAFLYVNSRDRYVVDSVRSILATVPFSLRQQFRLVERTELDQLGADPSVVLALAAVEGITFGSSDTGADLRPASQKGNHGYLPDYQHMQTGFIAYGKGIASHRVIAKMGLEDMAAIVAHLLNVPFKTDGVAYPGLFAK